MWKKEEGAYFPREIGNSHPECYMRMNKKHLFLICFLPTLLVMLAGVQLGVETFSTENGTNFEKRLSGHEVFFKSCRDFAFEPESNVVYFLESMYGKIFKVEWPTGRLIKTISRKGQGPAELHAPIGIVIKNKKLFVLDLGFNGVKIFDYEGVCLNEFKFSHILSEYRNIAVSNANEIFIGKPNATDNTMVSVYNMKGQKLRSLIALPGGADEMDENKISRDQFVLKIDGKGNLYLLFYMLRKLAKFDPQGKQLWEISLRNELLDQRPNTDFFKKKGNNTNYSNSVYDMEVLPKGDIIVGHIGGGCILDENGVLKKLLKLGFTLDGKVYNTGLTQFRLKDTIVLNSLMRGMYFFFYKLPI